ncbi:MAG TPA: glycosyl hydrolase [Polyangiaceae bacterium]
MMRPRSYLEVLLGLGVLAIPLACSSKASTGSPGEETTTGGGNATAGNSATSGGNATGGSVSAGGNSATGGASTTGGGVSTSGGTGGAAGVSGGAMGGASAGQSGAGGTGTSGASGSAGATGGGGASGGSDVCGTIAEGSSLTLSCPAGQTIGSVNFASFGTPTGTCGSLAKGTCDESASVAVMQALCLGRQSCSVPANTGTFGDPCNKTVKTLAADVTCSVGGGQGGPTTGQQPFKGVANSPCADRTKLNTSWYYDWEQTTTEACSNGAGGVFVPMIWGHTGSEQSASGISSAVASFVSKGYPYVLGFNEPDNCTQSNIPVDSTHPNSSCTAVSSNAINLWPSFLNSAIKTVSPAAQANTSGQAWTTTFFGDVNADSTALRTDVIGLHWYGWNAGSCDATASQLASYISWAEGIAGNRPIWLTEWGCLNLSAPDVQTVVNFYNAALAVFARHPRVQRYAWYPWSTNLALTNSDGSLTALGTAYAAAPAYK